MYFQVRGLTRTPAGTPGGEDDGPGDIDVGTEPPPLDPAVNHHHPAHMYWLAYQNALYNLHSWKTNIAFRSDRTDSWCVLVIGNNMILGLFCWNKMTPSPGTRKFDNWQLAVIKVAPTLIDYDWLNWKCVRFNVTIVLVGCVVKKLVFLSVIM